MMINVTGSDHSHQSPLEGLDPKKQIFAVASGKGGTGKSTFAINLSLSLATLGHDVILVDADLGGADVSSLLGVNNPCYTMKDFIKGEVKYMAEILEPTPSPRLRLILGGSDIISISNPYYQQKVRLSRNISQLEAAYIVVDRGPDITFNNLDFFNAAPVGFLITQNVDTIIMGFYRFLKAAFVRRLRQEFKNDEFIIQIINDFQNKGWSKTRSNLVGSIRAASQEVHEQLDSVLDNFQPKLVFNMVKGQAVRKTADQMFSFILENFGFRLQTAGFLPRDAEVEKCYARSEPYVLRYPKGNTTKAIFEVLTACGLNHTSDGQQVTSHSMFSKYLKAESEHWQFLKI
jgi:flagellar biosynthesis protein FlhG